MRCDDLLQGRAVDELHHDEGAAVLGDGEVVELGDVGVPELDREPRFAQEAVAQLRRDVQAGIEDLDDADLVEERCRTL